MRERILSEIRRLATKSGQAPGVRAFETETGILRREWMGKIWARWSDAIIDAGLKPNAIAERLPSEFILSKVVDCCVALGRVPSANDLKLFSRMNQGFPSTTTIENHYPKRALLVEALRTWVSKTNAPNCANILAMLPPSNEHYSESVSTQSSGYVYLLKAGDFYKIGQSSDLERRVKSINVALPDKATLEHAISTDDPSGIEAYWHRRFAHQRANGEWFRLAKADIIAFKKRKFQ